MKRNETTTYHHHQIFKTQIEPISQQKTGELLDPDLVQSDIHTPPKWALQRSAGFHGVIMRPLSYMALKMGNWGQL